MTSESKKTAIVFAPDIPGKNSGYEIAIESILKVYKELFADIHLLIFNHHKEKNLNLEDQVTSYFIDYDKQKKWIRFLKSLFNTKPASIQHFNSGYLKKAIAYELNKLKGLENPYLIFEDVPLAHFIPLAKEIFPEGKTIVRSHNVLSEVFLGFEKDSNSFLNLVWSWENNRIRKFEETVLERSDYFFAITEDDYLKYQALFEVKVDGVLSIGFDQKRYDSVADGKIENILYLGTADLRKGHGIKKFLDMAWPKVNQVLPRAKCILGGKYTDGFTDKNRNILGYGFINDEKSFLSKGKIFINPQQRGSGINLKSITAMLASKVLVSTPKGVEGIKGINRKHYVVVESTREFSEAIIQLVQNPQMVKDIGNEAQIFAKEAFSIESLKNKYVPRMKEVLFSSRVDNTSKFIN